jgi:hypothetical protein
MALLCFPKNLIPWRDSNPGLLVLEADAMSTDCAMPPRQGAPKRHELHILDGDSLEADILTVGNLVSVVLKYIFFLFCFVAPRKSGNPVGSVYLFFS